MDGKCLKSKFLFALFKCSKNRILKKKKFPSEVDEVRKYYEHMWNKMYDSKENNKEFFLDNGGWISDKNGYFGKGVGFTANGAIKWDRPGEKNKVKFDLNGNIIGHYSGSMLHSGRIFQVGKEAYLELYNGKLRAENVVDRGGVISLDESANLVCRQCSFVLNKVKTSGGVVYGGKNSFLEFDECKFRRNVAAGLGGAIFVESGSRLECSECIFCDNVVECGEGGAIYCRNGTKNVYLYNCRFENNMSQYSGGAIYIGSDVCLMCYGCLFKNNFSEEGIGSVIYANSSSEINLIKCKFRKKDLGIEIVAIDDTVKIISRCCDWNDADGYSF